MELVGRGRVSSKTTGRGRCWAAGICAGPAIVLPLLAEALSRCRVQRLWACHLAACVAHGSLDGFLSAQLLGDGVHPRPPSGPREASLACSSCPEVPILRPLVRPVLKPALQTLPASFQAYAERVARGFRPEIPKRWPDTLRELISMCWAQVCISAWGWGWAQV